MVICIWGIVLGLVFVVSIGFYIFCMCILVMFSFCFTYDYYNHIVVYKHLWICVLQFNTSVFYIVVLMSLYFIYFFLAFFVLSVGYFLDLLISVCLVLLVLVFLMCIDEYSFSLSWKEFEKTNRAKRGNRVVVLRLVLLTVGCLILSLL